MFPFLRLLFVMRRVAQRPIGRGQFWMVIGVLAICLSLALIEHFAGWPAWLTVQRTPLHRFPILR